MQYRLAAGQCPGKATCSAPESRELVPMSNTTLNEGSLLVGRFFAIPVAFVVVLALVATAWVRPALAEAKPRLPKCGTSGYGFAPVKPRTWDPGCTGGSPKFSGLEWSQWRKRAQGRGKVSLRVCAPDCVNGYYVKGYAARLEPRKVKRCAKRLGGKRTRMYTRVRIRIQYPAANPFGYRAGWRSYVQPLSCVK